MPLKLAPGLRNESYNRTIVMRVARIVPLVLLFAAEAAADPVSLRFENGFVTLSARNMKLARSASGKSLLALRSVNNAKLAPTPSAKPTK